MRMPTVSDKPSSHAASHESAFEAPGRVNLIGEHTDYTGGFVLPMAIPFTTVARIEGASDGNYHFSSATFSEVRTLSPADRSEKVGNWSDYPVGVLRQLQALGIDPPPFSLHISGNVPLGAGLSSSASIEVASAVALLHYSHANLPLEEIATLCRRAENEYVGSPCGIMDQFVVTAAVAGHALLLNTRDLTYELLPMNTGGLADCKIVVANSGVQHSIAGGDYGLRRREVEAGQAVIVKRFEDVTDLGDATLDQLAACKADMSPESYRRCRHIITENARVREARGAMLEGDPVRLGKAITAAHASERDDFECSVEEIDFLVETAVAFPGCYGARLTGGGFGGSTVNLVQASVVDAFAAALKDGYRKRFDLELETYPCEAVDGAVARAAGGSK